MVLASRQAIFPAPSAVLYGCVFSSFTASLHLLDGKGGLTAGGTGYTLHGLLWVKYWAHDHLQRWQAGLDERSDLSYSCVSALSQFDSLMFHHHWAILNIFCSLPGSYWWCFSVLPLFSLYGGKWPSPWVSPASDHHYLCLLLSHHNAASSYLQTQCYFCSPSPLHLLGSFDTLAYHVRLLFYHETAPFTGLSRCDCPLLCPHGAQGSACSLPGVSQANRPAFPPHPSFQGRPVNAINSAHSPVHHTFSLV